MGKMQEKEKWFLIVPYYNVHYNTVLSKLFLVKALLLRKFTHVSNETGIMMATN